MKNLYCFILITFLTIFKVMNLHAQEVDTTYSHGMHVIFQHLDKSKVPYGLLQDVALEVAELKYYKGDALLDSNRLFAENFDRIYLTLSTAQIHPSAAVNFPHPDLIDSIWFAKRKPGQVTLAGLYYKYSRFSDDAQSKITILNDQIYDKYVNGVWQNPYQTEQVVGFAPANFNYPGLNLNLLLPVELWLSNQQNAVENIEVDAGDGLGYRSLLPNVPLPVNYADSGLKVLKFKIWLNDNTIVQSHSMLHITSKNQVILPSREIPDVVYAEQEESFFLSPGNLESMVNNTVDFNPPLFIPPFPYWFLVSSEPKRDVFRVASSETINGRKVKGYVTIDYASDDKSIKKPLIVAEGFDPGVFTNPESMFGERDFRI